MSCKYKHTYSTQQAGNLSCKMRKICAYVSSTLSGQCTKPNWHKKLKYLLKPGARLCQDYGQILSHVDIWNNF